MNKKELKSLIRECILEIESAGIDMNDFIQFYKKRSAELVDHSNQADSSFVFHFEFYKGELSVLVDVIHSDTILSKIDDPDFDHDNFRMANYIPKVIEALKTVGIDAESGFVHHGKTISISKNVGKISVNDYETDGLTVQMDISDIEQRLRTNPQEVSKAIDAFMVKTIKVADLLEK